MKSPDGFTRMLLNEAHAMIRREFPGIKTSEASITGPSFKQFFVQFSQEGSGGGPS